MPAPDYSLQPWFPPRRLTRSVSQASPIYFAAIFGWSMSAVSAILCAMVREPLGGPQWFVFAKAFLLLGALISCALLLTVRRVEQHGDSYAVVIIATLGVMFLPCLSWLFGVAADIIIYPVLVALFAKGIGQIVAPGTRIFVSQSKLPISCGCLAGAGYFLLVNSKHYASVLTPEQAFEGLQHIDTLFHASIANMIVKHGALSAGLDGFVPLKYHILSHIWLGCLSLWLGVPTLDGYYIGPQVVWIPMLLFSLSLAVYLLRPDGARLANGPLILLLPLMLLFVTDAWNWTSYLISESYLFAIIMFLLALPLLAELAESRQARSNGLMFALGVVGILMMFSKVSVGFVFWNASGYLLWRRLGLTFSNLVKLAIPIVLVGLLAAGVILGNGSMLLQWLDPLEFVRESPDGAWTNIAANLLLLGAVMPVWFRGPPRDKWCAEAFAVIAIACAVPALLLQIPGGSSYYFINVGTWAGIVWACAYGGAYLERRFSNLLKPAFIVVAIVLLSLATVEKRSSAVELGDDFARLQKRIPLLTGNGPEAEPSTLLRLIALLVPNDPVRLALARDVERTPVAQSARTLQAVGLLREPRTAVFVAPENLRFWRTFKNCRTAPFFGPAVLGVPMLRGINPPELKCPKEPYYGRSAYPEDAVSQTTTDSELCDRARRWGLETIFILNSPTEVRKIACKTSR